MKARNTWLPEIVAALLLLTALGLMACEPVPIMIGTFNIPEHTDNGEHTK